MAATPHVEERNGTGVPTRVTAARFCTDDDAAPATAYPIPIPTSGTNRSYWKTHHVVFDGAFTSVSNIKLFTDGGGFGTGIVCNVGDETGTSGDYDQAAGTQGTSGSTMTDHSLITAVTDVFDYTDGSEKTVDTGTYTGSGDVCKFIVLQLLVGSNASNGDLTDETFTWEYDEV